MTHAFPLFVRTSLLMAGMLLCACSGPDDPGKATPLQGSERGACYPNATCDAGLICASDLCVKSTTPPEDMSAGEDMSSPADMSSGVDMPDMQQDMFVPTTDMGAPDMPQAQDMSDMQDMPGKVRLQEAEPNNGAMLDEVNALPLDALGVGAINVPGDTDIWRIDVRPGKIYVVTLTAPLGSMMQEHITVIDDGREGKSPGDDYVKIAQRGASDAAVTFVTMGQGGYFLAVRDRRDVGESVPTQGSAAHTYEIEVREVQLAQVTGAGVIGGGEIQGALATAGDVVVYPFTAARNTELRADLRARDASMDARMIVYSVSEQSWIARQDNRSAGDSNPLLDAPLFGEGEMWLIVENVTPEATALGYTISSQLVAP